MSHVGRSRAVPVSSAHIQRKVSKEKKGKVVDARCRDLTNSAVCQKGRENPGSVDLCDWHEVRFHPYRGSDGLTQHRISANSNPVTLFRLGYGHWRMFSNTAGTMSSARISSCDEW